MKPYGDLPSVKIIMVEMYRERKFHRFLMDRTPLLDARIVEPTSIHSLDLLKEDRNGYVTFVVMSMSQSVIFTPL